MVTSGLKLRPPVVVIVSVQVPVAASAVIFPSRTEQLSPVIDGVNPESVVAVKA